MVKRPQEALAESNQSSLPNTIRNLLKSKSAKTIAAIAGLFAAEANNPDTAEAQEMVTKVVTQDDFSGDLDETKWLVDTNYELDTAAFNDSGELILMNAAAVSPREGATPTPETPVVITGQWTPLLDQQSNTHALTIRLRTNGNVNQHPQNSVLLVAYTNLDVFLAKKTDTFYGKIAENKSKALKIGQTYTFRITDDGNNVSAEFYDAYNNRVIAISGHAPLAESSTGDKTIFLARDNGVSALDNVKITTLEEEPVEEPAPEPEETSSTSETAEEYLARLEQEYAAMEAEYQAAYEEWQAMLDSRDDILSQPETLTPQFYLDKNSNATHATLRFQNAQVGSEVIVKKAYGDGAVVIQKKLTESSGSMTLQTPHLTDERSNYYVYIQAPDGTVSYLGGWDTIYGKNYGNVTQVKMSDTQSAKLAYGNTDLVDAATVDAEIQQLEDATIALINQMRSTESELTAMGGTITTTSTESNEVAEIPTYSRMHVTQGSDDHRLNIQFMTPADNAEFIIETANPTLGAYHTKRVNTTHAGGIGDGYIDFSLHGISALNTKITVSMMVNGVLKDQAVLYQRDNRIAGGSNWEWGTEETGLSAENPIESQMEIVATNGAQLSLAAQTPYDNVSITVEGGGYLDRYSASNTGGSNLMLQNFAFNATNPSGVYKIKMYENGNGRLIKEIEFYWDAASKTITPGENQGTVSALSQEYIDEAQGQLDDQAGINDTFVSYESLRQVQRTRFYERSAFAFDDNTYEELIVRFPIQGHPDAGSILNEGMAAYESVLSELLEDAVDVAVAAWNGEDQEAAVEAFYRRYDELTGVRKLREFMIDFKVSFPSKQQILQDGLNIAQNIVGELQIIKEKNISMHKRSAYLASVADSETMLKLDRNAFDYNEFLIIQQYGEGSPEHLAYLDAWGLGDGDTFESALTYHQEYLAMMYGEGSQEYIDATKEYLDGVETQVLSYQETSTFIQFEIEDMVQSRLNARLDAMTIEERAEARGLLRLQEDGLLDEYFKDLFHGTKNELINLELGGNSNYSVIYLLDRDFKDEGESDYGNLGHAAMIMGSEDEGWYHYSFGKGLTGADAWFTKDGNLDVRYYETLSEAQASLDRYEDYLLWNGVSRKDFLSGIKEASHNLTEYYAAPWQNCDDIASDIISATGVDFDDNWAPNITFAQQLDSADSYGSWRAYIDINNIDN